MTACAGAQIEVIRDLAPKLPRVAGDALLLLDPEAGVGELVPVGLDRRRGQAASKVRFASASDPLGALALGGVLGGKQRGAAPLTVTVSWSVATVIC